jgi:hypothetical protein
MRHSRCFIAGLALGAAACAKPIRQPTGPNVVMITATDYAFGVPDTIPAGLTTFRLVNQGKELHHASLIRLKDGKTIADFQSGLQAAMQSHSPPPPWVSFAGGPNAVTPGDTGMTTETLEPGNYVFVCWIPTADGTPHIMKGMMHGMVVIAARGPVAAEPATDVSITLTDYDFAPSASLTAGTHTIRVENAGPQPHEIVITALAPGKALQDFIAWEKGGEKGPLPTGKWLGGVVAMGPGGHAQFTATFAPGNYLLLCFWPDAKDGKPHIVHGMAKQITVAEAARRREGGTGHMSHAALPPLPPFNAYSEDPLRTDLQLARVAKTGADRTVEVQVRRPRSRILEVVSPSHVEHFKDRLQPLTRPSDGQLSRDQ